MVESVRELNQYQINGALGGRPLTYDNIQQIEIIIDNHFNKLNNEKLPYTITGLADALDITRDTLWVWENEGDKYLTGLSDIIKKAKQKVIEFAEKKLYSRNTIGAIFHLKNLDRKNWYDKDDNKVQISLDFSRLLQNTIDAEVVENKKLIDNTMDIKKLDK